MSGEGAGRKRGRRGEAPRSLCKGQRPRALLAREAGGERARPMAAKKNRRQDTREGGKVGSMPTKRGVRTPLKKRGGQNCGRAGRNRRRGAVCGGALLLLIMAKSVGCYSHPRFKKKYRRGRLKRPVKAATAAVALGRDPAPHPRTVVTLGGGYSRPRGCRGEAGRGANAAQCGGRGAHPRACGIRPPAGWGGMVQGASNAPCAILHSRLRMPRYV